MSINKCRECDNMTYKDGLCHVHYEKMLEQKANNHAITMPNVYEVHLGNGPRTIECAEMDDVFASKNEAIDRKNEIIARLTDEMRTNVNELGRENTEMRNLLKEIALTVDLPLPIHHRINNLLDK